MSETEKKLKLSETKKANGKKGLVLLILGIIVLAAIVVFLIFTIFISPKAGDWYAVFLADGRTYFGHISRQNSQILILKDVYYLRVQQDPAEEGKEQPQPQISLVNVKDELYGPESEMQINRQQVLFTQKLRTDSQVVTTISQQKGQ